MAGGTGWISGWETFDARVWNSEVDGQHPDSDVQRQFRVGFEIAEVRPRATARRGVRRNMAAWCDCWASVRGFIPSTIAYYW